MTKKDKKDKNITKALEVCNYEPPKPKLNAKNIEALETLMKDDAFRADLGYRYQPIVDAYKCGQRCKKG